MKVLIPLKHLIHHHRWSPFPHWGRLKPYFTFIPFLVRAMRFFLRSTSLIFTSITSPVLNSSEGCLMYLSLISEKPSPAGEGGPRLVAVDEELINGVVFINPTTVSIVHFNFNFHF